MDQKEIQIEFNRQLQGYLNSLAAKEGRPLSIDRKQQATDAFENGWKRSAEFVVKTITKQLQENL